MVAELFIGEVGFLFIVETHNCVSRMQIIHANWLTNHLCNGLQINHANRLTPAWWERQLCVSTKIGFASNDKSPINRLKNVNSVYNTGNSIIFRVK
jgi:hypothetical protein